MYCCQQEVPFITTFPELPIRQEIRREPSFKEKGIVSGRVLFLPPLVAVRFLANFAGSGERDSCVRLALQALSGGVHGSAMQHLTPSNPLPATISSQPKVVLGCHMTYCTLNGLLPSYCCHPGSQVQPGSSPTQNSSATAKAPHICSQCCVHQIFGMWLSELHFLPLVRQCQHFWPSIPMRLFMFRYCKEKRNRSKKEPLCHTSLMRGGTNSMLQHYEFNR